MDTCIIYNSDELLKAASTLRNEAKHNNHYCDKGYNIEEVMRQLHPLFKGSTSENFFRSYNHCTRHITEYLDELSIKLAEELEQMVKTMEKMDQENSNGLLPFATLSNLTFSPCENRATLSEQFKD